jgi:hypothetical protein
MNGESEQSHNIHYPVSLYFHEALKWAIEDGDEEAIVAAVARQEPNNTTEGISNFLLARMFLVGQKGALTRLNNKIAMANTAAKVTELFDSYTDELTIQFNAVFPEKDSAERLNDAAFRAVLATRSEALPAIARQIATIDLAMLLPPDELLYDMQGVYDLIVESHSFALDNLRNNGFDDLSHEIIRDAVAMNIEVIDERLLMAVEKE